ncbi:MAG: hypothetical protein QOD77_996 [Thermoplasmata archaeon]|jgi:hypothetical protein|nr:hypothetical protein [Thermoplasmata archaeon]
MVVQARCPGCREPTVHAPGRLARCAACGLVAHAEAVPPPRPPRKTPNGVWIALSCLVVLVVLAGAVALVLSLQPSPLDKRLAAGDADGKLGPYTVEVTLSKPYIVATNLTGTIVPADGLAAWREDGVSYVVEARAGLEHQQRNESRVVYRDLRRDTPWKAILGTLGYQVADEDGRIASGKTARGSFELELDAAGRFAQLEVREPRLGNMTVRYAYPDSVVLQQPAPGGRKPVEVDAQSTRYNCGGWLSSCDGVALRHMRHSVRPEEIELRFEGAVANPTMREGAPSGNHSFRWWDQDRDGLVSEGDLVGYYGILPVKVVIFDRWAGQEAGSLTARSPSPAGFALVVVVLAAAVTRRRAAAP